jgi:hypothetical protein
MTTVNNRNVSLPSGKSAYPHIGIDGEFRNCAGVMQGHVQNHPWFDHAPSTSIWGRVSLFMNKNNQGTSNTARSVLPAFLRHQLPYSASFGL